MIITPATPENVKEPKEMMTIGEKNGKRFVSVNYSSISIINSCLRKAHYLLERNLKTEMQSPALTFGTAIHKALEHWYLFPRESRRQMTKAEYEKAQSLAYSDEALETEGDTLELEAIRRFCIAGKELRSLGPDKRGLENGIQILRDYFKTYADDPYNVYFDETGPCVERTCRMLLHEDPELIVEYHGTIDLVLEDATSGEIIVADHKTTSSLGKDFLNRIKPNHQYTGYVWLAQEVLAVPAQKFLVNGIQVAKTKTSFSRQFTDRTPEDFAEMKLAVLQAVGNYLDSLDHGFFPQNAPDPCGLWGGCQFLEVCASPENLRENIIQYQYGK